MEYATTGQFPLHLKHFVLFNRSSLRTRMAVSYVVVTLGSVFAFMSLVLLTSGALGFFFSNSLPSTFLTATQHQANMYALGASVQAQGIALDARTNFVPGHAHSLAQYSQADMDNIVPVPYVSNASTNPATVAIALLVAPDGHVVASSYPARYPSGTALAALLPLQHALIERALAGHSDVGTGHFFSVLQSYAVEPVWDKDHQPIGAIYLQAPGPDQGTLFVGLRSVLLINLFLLIAVTPIGVFFGWITTRGLVRRVQHLVLATTQFAEGDYSQRVVSGHRDEIGLLEQQFNRMAEQLVENIARRQQLAGQNARLEERSRISRELHDAISQDLFSLRMLADGLQEATRSGLSPADLRPHIAILEQTTGNMTREMRALLLELRPSQLEHLGLPGALKSLAHMYSVRLGLTVTTDLKPVQVNVKGKHALLRITQEALANAARHSSASVIALTLEPQSDQLELTIVDNGEGFCRENEHVQHGLGLHLMQERVEELGGTFDLQTAPGQGTRIRVCLPLEECL